VRRVVAAVYVSLDGVVENPSWTMPYWNDELARFQKELLFSSDALLLGRVTYQGFAAAWPNMTDEDGFADRMNSLPKFVATTTLEQAGWNATLLTTEVVDQVRALKEQPGQNLLVYGSAELLDTLTRAGLVDEYRLMVFPVVLGQGKRLFNDGATAALRLADAQTTATGVAILTYEPAVTATAAPG
jgi:dihydrofolate reductase